MTKYCVSMEIRYYNEKACEIGYLTNYTLYERYYDDLKDAERDMQSPYVKPYGTIALYLHNKHPEHQLIEVDLMLERLDNNHDEQIDFDIMEIWF